MKKLRFVIIGLIIVVIIIIAILLNLIKRKPNSELSYGKINKIELTRETNNATFMLANELINRFILYVFEEDEYIDCKEATFCLLDDNYKNKNNITKENVNNILNEYKGYTNYITREVYRVEITNSENIKNIFLYIKGIFRIDGNIKDIYLLMKEDLSNSTYNLQLLTEEQFETAKTTGIEEEEQWTDIEKNNYNKLYTKTVSNYELCLMRIEDFSRAYENNVEEAYLLLDEEYREKRFKNVTEFKELIDQRNQDVYLGNFTEYMVNDYGDYTQYVCKDEYGHIYIFKEEYPMQYKIQLDTYTIPTEQFIEIYEKDNNQTKVQMNINKFILMMNNKDYDSAYNVLADSFKKNYFPTKEEFIKYMKQKFYEYNNLEINSFEINGDTYICKTLLTDLTRKEKEEIEFNVVMQLGQKYNFVMSFEIDS